MSISLSRKFPGNSLSFVQLFVVSCSFAFYSSAAAAVTSPLTKSKQIRLRHVLHHGTSDFENQFKRLDFDLSEDASWTPTSDTKLFTFSNTDDDLRIEEEVAGISLRYDMKVKADEQPRPWNAWEDKPGFSENFWNLKMRELKKRSAIVNQQLENNNEWNVKSTSQGLHGAKAWQSLYNGELIGKLTPRKKKPINVPDITDPLVVLHMGYMAYNAYTEPSKSDWKDTGGWNVTNKFGWESDGIRGYIFVDEEQENVVLAYKGTTAFWPGIGGGPTSAKDKYNDNMMFSCCCAKVSWSWSTICDCATSVSECQSGCIFQSANFHDSYYNLAQTFYLAVKAWYPNANVYFTGHSLGGALASLVGLTNGEPAFTYQTPGDLLYAHRIGLMPDMMKFKNNGTVKAFDTAFPDYTEYLKSVPIFHFGNEHDPIFFGKCNGPSSTCWYGGYITEAKCHVGKECIYYDADMSRKKLSTGQVKSNRRLEMDQFARYDVRYHGMQKLIETYLEVYNFVPECAVYEKCQDCELWTWME